LQWCAGTQLGGTVAIQAALYIATAFLSNIIANNAAAALLFPIVLDVSKKQGIKLDLLAFLLMFGASSAFTTPYGYQTNLMVQDVGGYKPVHFARFGGPMQVRETSVPVLVALVPARCWVAWFAENAANWQWTDSCLLAVIPTALLILLLPWLTIIITVVDYSQAERQYRSCTRS
jgi:Na+/H+ antiporter NhaD/arsenite permease-like protein